MFTLLLYDRIYLLTAIGLTPGGSSTVHIYAQRMHRTTRSKQTIRRRTQLIGKSAGRAPSFLVFTFRPTSLLVLEEKYKLMTRKTSQVK